jgi:hypothetical protein
MEPTHFLWRAVGLLLLLLVVVLVVLSFILLLVLLPLHIAVMSS